MDHPIRLSDQLGQHLRSLRRLKGLSQTELGRRIGVGQARMGEIERNPGSVSLDQLLEVLAALDGALLLRTSTATVSETHPEATPTRQANGTPPHIKLPPGRGSW